MECSPHTGTIDQRAMLDGHHSQRQQEIANRPRMQCLSPINPVIFKKPGSRSKPYPQKRAADTTHAVPESGTAKTEIPASKCFTASKKNEGHIVHSLTQSSSSRFLKGFFGKIQSLANSAGSVICLQRCPSSCRTSSFTILLYSGPA